MSFSQDPLPRIPYEYVCQVIGRLFLESQNELDRKQALVSDFQQKLQASEQKIRELEATLRDFDSRLSNGNS